MKSTVGTLRGRKPDRITVSQIGWNMEHASVSKAVRNIAGGGLSMPSKANFWQRINRQLMGTFWAIKAGQFGGQAVPWRCGPARSSGGADGHAQARDLMDLKARQKRGGRNRKFAGCQHSGRHQTNPPRVKCGALFVRHGPEIAQFSFSSASHCCSFGE
jgi:hypothetical protein